MNHKTHPPSCDSTSQRLRARDLLRAATAIASALAIAACGAAGSSRPVASARPSHALAPATVPSVVVDYLFPASGADFALGQRDLRTFERTVWLQSSNRCLVAAGLPPQPPNPEGDERFGAIGLPNLAAIETTDSFGMTELVPNAADPGSSMSKAKAAAYQRATTRCYNVVPHFTVDTLPAETMQRAWMTEVGRAISSSALQTVERNGARCSAPTPFAARSITDAYYAVRKRVFPLILANRMARARAVEADGARVFVRCFGPAVMRQTQLLDTRRTAFVAAHAASIGAVQQATVREVSMVGARYGLTFGAIHDAGEARPAMG